MKQQDSKGKAREGYHHGNLREALVQAALAMIAERGVPGFAIAELARILGVSAAAPYRHFRDRDALLAELARRGFEGLEADMANAAKAAGAVTSFDLNYRAKLWASVGGAKKGVETIQKIVEHVDALVGNEVPQEP